MNNLSVCIEMFWRDLPFEERIFRVAQAGIGAIEFWNYSSKEIDKIARAVEKSKVRVAGFVCEPGFSLTGATSLDEHVGGVHRAAAVARTLDCRSLIVTTGNAIASEESETTRRRVVRKLKAMAGAAAEEGITLVLEPLNPVVDHQGYWLTTMAQAADLIEEVGQTSLKILYDIYHQQVTEGKIILNLRKYIDLIGHIHVAATPGRTNLVGGDLDYKAIFAAISKIGYSGYVGLELAASGAAEDALSEAQDLASAVESVLLFP